MSDNISLEELLRQVASRVDCVNPDALAISINIKDGQYELEYSGNRKKTFVRLEGLKTQMTVDVRKSKGIKDPIVAAHWMNDNHTFVKLSNDLLSSMAAIHEQWEQGFTHGLAFIDCVSLDGVKETYTVHARGNWEKFSKELSELYSKLLQSELSTEES